MAPSTQAVDCRPLLVSSEAGQFELPNQPAANGALDHGGSPRNALRRRGRRRLLLANQILYLSFWLLRASTRYQALCECLNLLKLLEPLPNLLVGCRAELSCC